MTASSIRWNRSAPAFALALLVALLPVTARAFDYNLKVEPGVAFPLTSPQKDLYGVGGAVAIKGGIGFWGILDLQLAGHFVGLSNPNQGSSLDPGEAWGLGGGLRLKLPYRISIVSPWVDADALYIRTGGNDRFGYTVGLGLAFALNKSRTIHLGPFVRYLQIVQPDHPGTLNEDAKVLIVGVSFEIGSSTHPRSAPATELVVTLTIPDRDGDGVPDGEDRCPDVAGPKANQGCPLEPDSDGDGVIDSLDRCPTLAGPKELKGCPDRDKDGVADRDDYCPDLAGPIDNHGCPKYGMVTVCAAKLDLAEKVFFDNDQSTILPKSFPLLAEVVATLKDAKMLRVRIEGHTDSSGTPAHNQTLSEERAKAVRDYLIHAGIEASRLEARGFGQTQPLESNHTFEGRERNREVDFVILNPADDTGDNLNKTSDRNTLDGSVK